MLAGAKNYISVAWKLPEVPAGRSAGNAGSQAAHTQPKAPCEQAWGVCQTLWQWLRDVFRDSGALEASWR